MWLAGSNLPQANPRAGTLPTRIRIEGLQGGLPGAIQTLTRMRDLARASLREPAQQIRETALALTVGSSGWTDQVRALQSWIQTNVRYVQDPIDDTGGVELVQSPQKTLDYGAGDCDDQATLLAALLSAVGHPARFIAVGFRGEPLSHVLTQTKVGSCWVSAETIQPRPLGWFPSGVTSHYLMKV